MRHLNFPGNTEPFKRTDRSMHGTCRCCKLLGRITYNHLDSKNYCKEQWQVADGSMKLQKLSHSEVFQTLWQKSILLTLCTQVLEYGTFCYTFCSSKICHLHIECGLSGSPICIGFCHCLQVITLKCITAVPGTARCEVSRYVEEGEAGVEKVGNLPAATSRSCVAGITVSG